MVAILGKGFISCLISSNNRNLQLLSCQKIYTLLGVLWNVWPWSSDSRRLSFGVHWYLKTERKVALHCKITVVLHERCLIEPAFVNLWPKRLTRTSTEHRSLPTNYSYAKWGITVKNAVLFRARKFAVFTTPLPHPLILVFQWRVRGSAEGLRTEDAVA